MNARLVKIPAVNANDDSAELVKWLVPDRAFVAASTPVALVETTKAAIEIVAAVDGYCAHLYAEGERLAVGVPLAVLLEKPDQEPDSYLEEATAVAAEPSARLWTKKAEMVARKLGVDIERLAERLNRVVTEADVLGSQQPEASVSDLVDDCYPQRRRERVLLIGGGGGGGAITIDAIARTQHQRAVAILDNNRELHGKTLMGVPVLGSNDLAETLWREGRFDAAIIVVTAKIDQRATLFEELRSKGIPLTNVIDPSTQIRANVQMGVGNLIMGNGFLAACVTLGDNNFLASHVCIEHHSKVGNHCTFGPRTATSGAVTIGNRVKFGMGVLVEPYLSIGDDSLLPSGVVVSTSVPDNMVLKVQSTYSLRKRD